MTTFLPQLEVLLPRGLEQITCVRLPPQNTWDYQRLITSARVSSRPLALIAHHSRVYLMARFIGEGISHRFPRRRLWTTPIVMAALKED